MFSQGGKSEALLDIIGHRLDTSPVPILYTGPSKQFITEQWEPRIEALFEEAPALRRKRSRSVRHTKTKKVVSGVPLRLAHGGSSTALKSDPAGLAVTDEADELLANVKGQGNPIRLIDQRGDTYQDFVHAVVSTPTTGVSSVEVDPETGLEFWSVMDPEQIHSVIWKLWQAGTRHHWAWPCPHCGTYFIPRFERLKWDKPIGPDGKELKSTPELARKSAYIVCPCGCPIEQSHQEWMNERGVPVAPGQAIDEDGNVIGRPPESLTYSLWVSGLANPFKSWGDRAAKYVEAVRSRDPSEIQTVINAAFGELYDETGGDVPAWDALRELSSDTYVTGQVPSGVKLITVTVDVQKDCLVYTVRGWGAQSTSWLIEADYLYGPTHEQEVWDALEELLLSDWDGIPVRLGLIDAGFRPGKKDQVPVHMVYEFCRKHKSLVKPTKGSSSAMMKPIMVSKIDVNSRGKLLPRALELHRLDTDHWKQWVHGRLCWDIEQKGAWLLPEDVTEDYLKQIVSEARVRRPSGKVVWIQRSKDNHFFDCEAMQAAAAAMLNVSKLKDSTPVRRRTERSKPDSHNDRKRDRFLGDGSIW